MLAILREVMGSHTRRATDRDGLANEVAQQALHHVCGASAHLAHVQHQLRGAGGTDLTEHGTEDGIRVHRRAVVHEGADLEHCRFTATLP